MTHIGKTTFALIFYHDPRPSDSLSGGRWSRHIVGCSSERYGDSLREYACRPSVQRELRQEIQSGFSLAADAAAITDGPVAILPRLDPLLIKEEQQAEQSAYITPRDTSTSSNFNNTLSYNKNL